MDTKRFPLRTILTATTGRLLTKSKGEKDNGIADLYELLGWMTGEAPFTHQLGRFAKECVPWLLKWFPELKLAGVDALDHSMHAFGAEKGIEAWLAVMSNPEGTYRIKSEYDVPKIPAHVSIDPVEEMVELMSNKGDER